MAALIRFDQSTALGRHAEAERRRSLLRAAGFRHVDATRNKMYQAYTHTPHPSTLGLAGGR